LAALRLTDTQLGFIMGMAFAVCYSIASLPLARISDTGRAKQVLFACIVIWSLMTGIGGLATGFVSLALSRLGVALGEAGGTPASHAMILVFRHNLLHHQQKTKRSQLHELTQVSIFE